MRKLVAVSPPVSSGFFVSGKFQQGSPPRDSPASKIRQFGRPPARPTSSLRSRVRCGRSSAEVNKEPKRHFVWVGVEGICPSPRTCANSVVPASIYAASPKPPGDRSADASHRSAPTGPAQTASSPLHHHGKLHHIGTDREHARTLVFMLVPDLHIRIINAATGELIRELIFDPHATTRRPAGHPGQKPKHPAQTRTRDVLNDLRFHKCGAEGI